jgi:hypothetical protein
MLERQWCSGRRRHGRVLIQKDQPRSRVVPTAIAIDLPFLRPLPIGPDFVIQRPTRIVDGIFRMRSL